MAEGIASISLSRAGLKDSNSRYQIKPGLRLEELAGGFDLVAAEVAIVAFRLCDGRRTTWRIHEAIESCVAQEGLPTRKNTQRIRDLSLMVGPSTTNLP